MWTNGNGYFYVGDLQPGDRAATPSELATYNAANLAVYAYDAMINVLKNGQTFNVAASGQPAVKVLVDGTETTLGVLGLFALFGQANPSGTKSWRDNDGVTTVLTGTQCVTMATVVGVWADDVYAALETVENQIASGAITTAAQIDSYDWPTS